MVWIFLCCGTVISGQNTSELLRLLSNKMEIYNKDVRPVKNMSHPIIVSVGVYIFAIRDFDEVFEALTLSGCIYMVWRNAFLTWNPSDYGDIYDFHLPSSSVWLPTVVNINTAKTLKALDANWLPVVVSNDGATHFTPPYETSVSCKVNVYYYPFDIQTCYIKLVAWAYKTGQVTFRLLRDKVGLELYESGGPWIIINTSVSFVEEHNVVIVSLSLERKSTFVVLNSVCPIVLFAFLNTAVFFIPPESGERISYCLTVLLAITVFLTLVGETLPKTAKPVSLFSIYILITLLLSVFVTLATIYSLSVYYSSQEEEDSSKFWKSVYRCFSCKRRTKRLKNIQKYNCCKPEVNYIESERCDSGNAVKKQCLVASRAERNSTGKDVVDKETSTDEKVDCRLISRMLDIIFFAFFITLIVFSTIALGVIIVKRI